MVVAKLTLRALLVVSCLFSINNQLCAVEADLEVPMAVNFYQDARVSQINTIPILVVFFDEHCTYCERLEEQFLRPMLLNEQYRDKVLIRKVEIGGEQTLINFHGGKMTHAKFAARYRVELTPTLILVDRYGRQLVESIVGLNTVEFFGWYLDQAIDESQKMLEMLDAADGQDF